MSRKYVNPWSILGTSKIWMWKLLLFHPILADAVVMGVGLEGLNGLTLNLKLYPL